MITTVPNEKFSREKTISGFPEAKPAATVTLPRHRYEFNGSYNGGIFTDVLPGHILTAMGSLTCAHL